ncbi:hypothetical protein [uncultured Vibrio sp.]|nr:hypothetical protein [uncultured Vibrio sp.]
METAKANDCEPYKYLEYVHVKSQNKEWR